MNLLERIDLALQHARASRGELAKAIGVETQAISNLKRRPGSFMRADKLAKAARWMKCDVYWLCTGEPDEYMPDLPAAAAPLVWGFHACEVARWLDALPTGEQELAFARIYQVCADINSKLTLGAPPPSGSPKPRGSARP